MMQRIVRFWLYSIVFLCLLIVMVGGATRLTGSGLSITQWHPINGVVPPLTQAAWLAEFAKYKQIAQYKELNATIDIAGFKYLYWWEWTHRLLARLVGLVALLPLCIYLPARIFFSYKKLPRAYEIYIYIIPLLVGLQGIIGWWMVYSGLAGSKLTSVSQYRLAMHMITASLIIMITTYLARSLIEYVNKAAPKHIQVLAAIFSIAILIQIYLGALVSGLHAGLSYNTWPLIDGRVVPKNLLLLHPWWHNFFENVLTVQFVHRCWAYVLFLIASINMLCTYRACGASSHTRRSLILLCMVAIQIFLGVCTLLWRAPIGSALLHQFFALLLLVFSVMHWRATKANLKHQF